jgi:hypothetical protein
VSTTSAPGAAGAVIEARAEGQTQKRMVVSGGRPFADGPTVIDFGWPGVTSIDLTIRWPSGAVQELSAVPTRTTRTVTEPSS